MGRGRIAQSVQYLRGHCAGMSGMGRVLLKASADRGSHGAWPGVQIRMGMSFEEYLTLRLPTSHAVGGLGHFAPGMGL